MPKVCLLDRFSVKCSDPTYIFQCQRKLSKFSNAFHSFGSSKSLITKEAPASSSNFSGFLVPTPTTGIPAATPALTPDAESLTTKTKMET